MVRVAVVGVGYWGPNFARIMDELSDARLVAICDSDSKRLDKLKGTYPNARLTGNVDEIIAAKDIDAVVVATGSDSHYEITRKCLETGKHVLVEKPLGVDVEECAELQSLAAATGLVVQVGNNKRFDPGIAFARQFIQDELGQIMGLKAWYCDSLYRYTMTDNLQPIMVGSEQVLRPAGNPKADKRRYFMLTHGSHLVDTARFLGGEIVSVHARLFERFDAYCWFVAVEFASGALGHLDLVVAVRGDWEEGFQVYGELGSVKGKTHLPWFHKTSEVECFSVRDRQIRRPLGEDAHTYKLQVEGFADSILTGAPLHGASLADGAAALRALVAIARSVETGQPVRLADVQGGV